MSKVIAKNQARVIQARMKELGYEDFKLGHAQELIASLHGEKSWNVLSQVENIEPIAYEELPEVLQKPLKKYTVRIDADIQCKALIEVASKSLKDAHRAVRFLIESEDSCLFDTSNWKPNYVSLDENFIRITEITSKDGSDCTVYNDGGLELEDIQGGVSTKHFDRELYDSLMDSNLYRDIVRSLAVVYRKENESISDDDLVNNILFGSNDIYDCVLDSVDYFVDDDVEDYFIEQNQNTFINTVIEILELGPR